MRAAIAYTVDLGILGEVDLEVEYIYSEGRPGRAYMPNGDPGYPDEPAELEIVKVTPDFPNGLIADYLAGSDEFFQAVGDVEIEREHAAAEAYYQDMKEIGALQEADSCW